VLKQSLRSCFRGMLLASALAWSVPAWASADYYVESPSTPDRAVAEAQLESLPPLGEDIQARVIRRFRVGEGWAFVIRVDSLEQEQAQTVAQALSQGDQIGVVYRRIGSRTVRVMEAEDSHPEAPVPAETGEADGAQDPDPEAEGSSEAEPFEPRLRSTESVLENAVRAHGGEAGGALKVEAAGSVHFVYERTMAGENGTLVVQHDFIRWGEGLYLQIEMTEGEGVDSLTVVDRHGAAWVMVDDKKTDRDQDRTTSVLSEYGPGQILGIAMHLAEQVETNERWSTMVLVGNEASPGGERVVLQAPEGSGRGLEEVAFDAVHSRLVSASLSTLEGTIRMAFEDYRLSESGLVYPSRLTVWQDEGLAERIVVQRLELNQPVDPSLFEVPAEVSPN
jgi:hypothetical protein